MFRATGRWWLVRAEGWEFRAGGITGRRPAQVPVETAGAHGRIVRAAFIVARDAKGPETLPVLPRAFAAHPAARLCSVPWTYGAQ